MTGVFLVNYGGGHRIPAWYHKETGEVYVGTEAPADIEKLESR